VTEADLIERVRNRSEFRSGYFLPHLGYGGRIADAVWLDWTRSPPVLVGFEMKCARGDWLKELRDPWKAFEIGRFCHRWYLVVSKPAIVRPGELPESWGLMVARGETTRIQVRAPTNPDPRPWTPELCLAILNKVTNRGYGADRDSELDAARRAGREEERKSWERRWKAIEKDLPLLHEGEAKRLRRLEEEVKAFEEASGIEISAWAEGRRLGEAVKLVERGEFPRWLERAENSLERIGELGAELRARIRRAKEEVS